MVSRHDRCIDPSVVNPGLEGGAALGSPTDGDGTFLV